MRQNSVKLEKMRPELEKLQKQYANDKNTYNQKMMALYKKNGYSMMSGCLPMIVTLVIFIVVISAFNKYSTYQNIKYVQNMNTAFNNVVDYGIEEVFIEGEDGKVYYIERNKNGSVTIFDDKILESKQDGETVVEIDNLKAEYFDDNADAFFDRVVYSTNPGYILYTKTMTTEDGGATYVFTDSIVSSKSINLDGLKASELNADFEAFKTANLESGLTEEELANAFILDLQQTASAEKYREENQDLLWIKNIWGKDKATESPLSKSLKEFNSRYTHKKVKMPITDPVQYDNLTAKLGKEKKEANGYYIMVVISAGVSLLTQYVTSKSQKAQLELQSVDGQGAMQNKMMMFMMPVMMGVFSLMYTAAFSLYIICNSIISILMTLLINYIVKIKVDKEDKKQEAERDKRYRKPKQ